MEEQYATVAVATVAVAAVAVAMRKEGDNFDIDMDINFIQLNSREILDARCLWTRYWADIDYMVLNLSFKWAFARNLRSISLDQKSRILVIFHWEADLPRN